MVQYPASRQHRRPRRRWKGIIIGAGLVIVLGAGALGVRRLLDARRGRQMIAWGDAAMAAGRYDDAVVNYGRAVGRYPQDAELADKYADALYQTSAARPKALFDAQAVWQQVVSTYPDHLPTLLKLMSLDAEIAEVRPSSSAFSNLGHIAGAMLQYQPENAEAKTLELVAPLGPWASGKTASSPHRETDIQNLAAVLDQNPTDAKALYYFTLAAARVGIERTVGGDAFRIQAVGRLQTALHSPHADEASLYRTAEGMFLLNHSRSGNGSTSQPAATQPAVDATTIKLLADAREAVDRAAQLAKPQDRDFPNIRVLQAQIAIDQGDRPAAVANLKQVIAQRPDAIAARIVLADLLNALDSGTAIQLLDETRTVKPVSPGAPALVFEELKTRAAIVEAELCVNAASVEQDANLRATKVSAAQAVCERAQAGAESDPVLLKAIARLRLLQGKYIEAIHEADMANQKAGHSDRGQDPDLSYIKAVAFWSLHEPHEALGVLDAALAINGELESHRRLRATILETADKQVTPASAPSGSDLFTQNLQAARAAVQKNNFPQARQLLKQAAVGRTDDPDVLDLEFNCDLIEHQWDAAQRCAEKLAGSNRDQMNGLWYQFQLAQARGDTSAALSVATTLTRQFEKISQSWMALGLALQTKGNAGEARDAYQHAWYLEPTNLVVLKGLAQCCMANSRETEADSWIQQGRKIAPADADFRAMEVTRRLEVISSFARSSPPQWDRVEQLLADARAALPDDPSWDATESRMWWARGDAGKAYPLTHKAILLAERNPDADPAIKSTLQARQLRATIREEMVMLLSANNDDELEREARRIIDRYGNADIASAWAHLDLAILLHRQIPPGDKTADELQAALDSAQSAGDVAAGLELVGRFAGEAGPVEALHGIAGLGSALPGTLPDFDRNIQWDVLRADLLEQSGNLTAASDADDAVMPNLAKLPPKEQIAFLRQCAVIYSKSQPNSQVDKVIHAYEQLLERLPKDLPALNNLAWTLVDQANPPQPAKALTYSQKAFDVMTQSGRFDPQIADTHGWVLANNGHLADAIALLEKVVQQLPSPETEDHLGEAEWMAGHLPESRRCLSTALELLRAEEKDGHEDVPLRRRLEAAQKRAADSKSNPTTSA